MKALALSYEKSKNLQMASSLREAVRGDVYRFADLDVNQMIQYMKDNFLKDVCDESEIKSPALQNLRYPYEEKIADKVKSVLNRQWNKFQSEFKKIGVYSEAYLSDDSFNFSEKGNLAKNEI